MIADALLREQMVREYVAARGIADSRVLAAMREVPRHRFVREHLWSQAYSDCTLPIGFGQTLSQPYIVARMTELLELSPDHKVLEVGTGTGYQTAILAKLARWVYSLERIPELARQAIQRMRELGIVNVKIQAFDGTLGWSEAAPFDRILVAAAAPKVPEPLLEQLATGGILVLPEGDRDRQQLVVYQRGGRRVSTRVVESVAFVPLVGRYGWPSEGEPER